MKEHASLAAQRGDFRHGLPHAGLVVRRHHRDKRGLIRQRRAHLGGVEQPARIHAENRDAESFPPLQVLERMQHRMMLGRASDEMFPARRMGTSEAEDGEIVRLGASAGENDFVLTAAEQLRHPVSRIIQRRARLAARRVDGRRIPVKAIQVRPHRVERLGRERSGGVVVEVNHRRFRTSGVPRAISNRFPAGA